MDETGKSPSLGHSTLLHLLSPRGEAWPGRRAGTSAASSCVGQDVEGSLMGEAIRFLLVGGEWG